jgi:hypothetical protein
VEIKYARRKYGKNRVWQKIFLLLRL